MSLVAVARGMQDCGLFHPTPFGNCSSPRQRAAGFESLSQPGAMSAAEARSQGTSAPACSFPQWEAQPYNSKGKTHRRSASRARPHGPRASGGGGRRPAAGRPQPRRGIPARCPRRNETPMVATGAGVSNSSRGLHLLPPVGRGGGERQAAVAASRRAVCLSTGG